MFNRDTRPPITNQIGEATSLKGELHFGGGLGIDGEVVGDVVADPDASSLVVIGEKARVHGKVTAGHVIIKGEVRGPIVSTALLELHAGARVVGDIRYELLEMQRGATIDGALSPLNVAEKPELRLAASSPD